MSQVSNQQKKEAPQAAAVQQNTSAQSEQQPAEKKNRFQISREVQEEFVNEIAQNMLELAGKGGKWQKPWGTKPIELPFCPMTGHGYGGANMTKLVLTGLMRGYSDERWMTFKQLQKFQSEHPGLDMHITKGAKGVRLLRPQELAFTVNEDGSWNYLDEKEMKEIEEMKQKGFETPEVKRVTLFYPFTVFNAEQVEGFPPKENPTPRMTDIERNAFVEDFISCSGVQVRHHDGEAFYAPDSDIVKMPHPSNFTMPEEYYSTKLHEFYHATGSANRENRNDKPCETIKSYAFEEMRAEIFSLLAGAHLDLPMPLSNSAAYVEQWNQEFSGGDVRAVFMAATEAARMLTVLRDFKLGEQPKAKWYPPSNEWAALRETQRAQDAKDGVKFAQDTPQQADKPTPTDVMMERTEAALSPVAAKDTFRQANEPMVQARLLLQNPELLQQALKQDPTASRALADLCASFATTLSMELDNAQNVQQAAGQQEESFLRM